MFLGIVKSDDEMAQLFDTAQRLGQALGIDTARSIHSLVTGIGRQSRLMLDNLGIIVDTKKANEDYAESLGKSVSQLTEQEQKLALEAVRGSKAKVSARVNKLGDTLKKDSADSQECVFSCAKPNPTFSQLDRISSGSFFSNIAPE